MFGPGEVAGGAQTTVLNPANIVLGPLAGAECRRAVARGWLILVRSLAAVALLFVALVPLWFWLVAMRFDPYHLPFYELRYGLIAVEGMLVTIALVLGPAVLAGSLAGEKERGVLGLLLTTRVNSYEIVAGRLTGKLSQIGMILLAGLPALIMLGGLTGVRPRTMLVLVLLPVAVGLGGGGLAALSSIVSRRGRDALLSVYLVDLFLMLSPLSGVLRLPLELFAWLRAFNPYTGVEALAFRDDVDVAFTSIGVWCTLGVVGTALAAWRLRPSALAPLDGERVARRGRRIVHVPPIADRRPMIWKELFIERVATLGRFGRWAGRFLVVALIGGSLALVATIVIDIGYFQSHEWAVWASDQLEIWIGRTGGWLCYLVEWAIGLRAAVSISSERERGTWDALLTSPLEGGEILWGKLWGSLHALRWLVMAAFVAWTVAAASGAISVGQAAAWGAQVLFVGAFMAAVGVRTSLVSPTATRAMSLTIGIWLGALVAVLFSTLVLLAIFTLLYLAVWLVMNQPGLGGQPAVALRFPISAATFGEFASNLLYLIATLIIMADSRLRFDRLAGRMTGGGMALAADQFLHERGQAPDFILESEPTTSTDPEPEAATLAAGPE